MSVFELLMLTLQLPSTEFERHEADAIIAAVKRVIRKPRMPRPTYRVADEVAKALADGTFTYR